jgi:rubredoxin
MELVSIDGEKCVTIEQTGTLLKTKEGQLTIVANSTSSQVVAWRCDFCGVEFDNYNATAAHELECTNNSARVETGVGHPSSSPAAVTMPAWDCDFCGLKFDDYDVAVTHELGCSKNSAPLNP